MTTTKSGRSNLYCKEVNRTEKGQSVVLVLLSGGWRSVGWFVTVCLRGRSETFCLISLATDVQLKGEGRHEKASLKFSQSFVGGNNRKKLSLDMQLYTRKKKQEITGLYMQERVSSLLLCWAQSVCQCQWRLKDPPEVRLIVKDLRHTVDRKYPHSSERQIDKVWQSGASCVNKEQVKERHCTHSASECSFV